VASDYWNAMFYGRAFGVRGGAEKKVLRMNKAEWEQLEKLIEAA